MFLLLLLRWRYSPGWALASFTIRLQASRALGLSLNSFIPIFLRSVDTSFLVFLFVLLHTAFRTSFFGIAGTHVYMKLFTRKSPHYHLLKYLLFLLKHPVQYIRFVCKSLKSARSFGSPVRCTVPTPIVRLKLFPLASYFERHLLEMLE